MARSRKMLALAGAALVAVVSACGGAIEVTGEATDPISAPAPTAAVAAEAVPTIANDGPAGGDHTVALAHDGRDRRYVLHVPAGLPSGPVPLVVVLHGGGGSATQVQAQVGMDAIADREGFLVLYPDGVGPFPDRLHTWNAGPRCCGVAQRDDVDDVGFIAAAIDDVIATMPVAADRIYMTGHSNGSMMTYRFAAETSGLVAAIAPVGGAAHEGHVPGEPLPMMHIHSVDDPRALYGGGEGPPFPGTDHTVVHVGAMVGIDAFATANGCSGDPVEAEVIQGTGRSADHTATRLEWEGCTQPVVHLRLTGTGHGWPGVSDLNERIVGPATDVIDASEEVWAFVSQFVRS